MRSVSPVVLLPLIVFGVAVTVGLVAAAVRGFAAWRAFRRFRRTIESRLAEVAAALTVLERRVAEAAETAARLNEARVRLQGAIAIARMLTGGIGEAWALAGLLRSVMPRK